jgi:hypothetical protein
MSVAPSSSVKVVTTSKGAETPAQRPRSVRRAPAGTRVFRRPCSTTPCATAVSATAASVTPMTAAALAGPPDNASAPAKTRMSRGRTR